MNSFIEYNDDCPFPIENLPYGVFSREDSDEHRIGVAIGDKVLDLAAASRSDIFNSTPIEDHTEHFYKPVLNSFMDSGRYIWSLTRSTLTWLLNANNPALRDDEQLRDELFIDRSSVTMHLPANIGDYTDFYSSKNHAINVGTMFRGKENALKENWLHLPVGYHGRASSVVVSGTDIRRPMGQTKPGDQPIWGPCKLLDLELEIGAFVGKANSLGSRISIDDAENYIFGVVLMNDWSARDIQKWEYVPLGPFNGKNFGTTISPWIVTLDALEPFKVQGEEQKDLLPYLQDDSKSHYNVKLEVSIKGKDQQSKNLIATSNMYYLYWSMKQQLTHHSSTGCNMRSGDLMGSGTISGPNEKEFGSMLELSWKGTKEVQVGDETRKFLKDGDTVYLNGYAEGYGYTIGFGECVGTVLPTTV